MVYPICQLEEVKVVPCLCIQFFWAVLPVVKYAHDGALLVVWLQGLEAYVLQANSAIFLFVPDC